MLKMYESQSERVVYAACSYCPPASRQSILGWADTTMLLLEGPAARTWWYGEMVRKWEEHGKALHSPQIIQMGHRGRSMR